MGHGWNFAGRPGDCLVGLHFRQTIRYICVSCGRHYQRHNGTGRCDLFGPIYKYSWIVELDGDAVLKKRSIHDVETEDQKDTEKYLAEYGFGQRLSDALTNHHTG